jgi:hypothetical protein
MSLDQIKDAVLTGSTEPTEDFEVITSSELDEIENGGHTTVVSSREKKANRIARMEQFWAIHSVLYLVGYFLAKVTKTGQTIAERIYNGESFPMSSINIKGKNYPLKPGFVLSKATLGVWMCPACSSAHGTDRTPSNGWAIKGLASNKFYYSPVTQELFVISNTCFEEYVRGLSKSHRIIDNPPAPKPVVATVQVNPEAAPEATDEQIASQALTLAGKRRK